jgi:glutathionyl-hydroquinone reductase
MSSASPPSIRFATSGAGRFAMDRVAAAIRSMAFLSPSLDGYLRDLYQQPCIAETVNFDHINRHYYITHYEINPTRIVPIGPALDLTRPHGRERM